MPCFRSSSATAIPASASRRIATICASVNFDFRIVHSGQNPPKSNFRLCALRGSLRPHSISKRTRYPSRYCLLQLPPAVGVAMLLVERVYLSPLANVMVLPSVAKVKFVVPEGRCVEATHWPFAKSHMRYCDTVVVNDVLVAV